MADNKDKSNDELNDTCEVTISDGKRDVIYKLNRKKYMYMGILCKHIESGYKTIKFCTEHMPIDDIYKTTELFISLSDPEYYIQLKLKKIKNRINEIQNVLIAIAEEKNTLILSEFLGYHTYLIEFFNYINRNYSYNIRQNMKAFYKELICYVKPNIQLNDISDEIKKNKDLFYYEYNKIFNNIDITSMLIY